MSTKCGEQSQGPSTSHSSLHKVTASHLGRHWSRSQASSISVYAAVTWGFSCVFFVRLTLQGNLARPERTGRKRKNQSSNAGMQSENSGVRKPECRSCPAPPGCLVLSGLNEGENLSSQSLGELWVQARGAPVAHRGL